MSPNLRPDAVIPSTHPGPGHGVVPYLGETIRPLAGEGSDWHTHGFGQITSALSGSMYLGTPERVHLLCSAMAIWIPPDTQHWLRYGTDNEMIYVDVSREEAEHLGARCRVIAMTPLLESLMAATVPTAPSQRSQAHISALHALLREELLAAIDVPLSVAMPQDRRIIAAARAALEAPGAVGSATDWLRGVAAGQKTIERLFLAETGMTPARWLRQVRILHAITRLAAGDKVGTVALDMGYESASAFSYMFRRVIGVSPSRFLPS